MKKLKKLREKIKNEKLKKINNFFWIISYKFGAYIKRFLYTFLTN